MSLGCEDECGGLARPAERRGEGGVKLDTVRRKPSAERTCLIAATVDEGQVGAQAHARWGLPGLERIALPDDCECQAHASCGSPNCAISFSASATSSSVS